MIVEIDKLPQSFPYSEEELMAHVTFQPLLDTAEDQFFPLNVELPPGEYGVIFGSGIWGADGEIFFPYDSRLVVALLLDFIFDDALSRFIIFNI